MNPAVRQLFEAVRQAAPQVEPFLLNAPTSEWAVVFLLGQLSVHGGFQLAGGSGSFPDCILRVTANGQPVDLSVELELTSSQYIRHKHPPRGCDAVICWIDNVPNLGIPTLALCSLFPNAPTPAPAQIEFNAKQPKLVQVFRYFHEWLSAWGFPLQGGGGNSGTHTYTYLFQGNSLCSLQFQGKENNEYVRFRFYKKQLDLLAIRQSIVDLMSRVANPLSVRYGGELLTEEHLDFYEYTESVCRSVSEGLAVTFRNNSIRP